MRKILIVVAALCLAACGDDPGWSRDELPANARVVIEVTGFGPAAPCQPWALTTVRVSALDTDAPTAVTATSNGTCAWDGDAINCPFTGGQEGTMRIDFEASTARLDIPGAGMCFTEYAITEIGAL
jgi:hypothetical protein